MVCLLWATAPRMASALQMCRRLNQCPKHYNEKVKWDWFAFAADSGVTLESTRTSGMAEYMKEEGGGCTDGSFLHPCFNLWLMVFFSCFSLLILHFCNKPSLSNLMQKDPNQSPAGSWTANFVPGIAIFRFANANTHRSAWQCLCFAAA